MKDHNPIQSLSFLCPRPSSSTVTSCVSQRSQTLNKTTYIHPTHTHTHTHTTEISHTTEQVGPSVFTLNSFVYSSRHPQCQPWWIGDRDAMRAHSASLRSQHQLEKGDTSERLLLPRSRQTSVVITEWVNMTTCAAEGIKQDERNRAGKNDNVNNTREVRVE